MSENNRKGVMLVFDGDNIDRQLYKHRPINYKQFMDILLDGRLLYKFVYFISIRTPMDEGQIKFIDYLKNIGIEVITINKKIKKNKETGKEYEEGYNDGEIFTYILRHTDFFDTLILGTGDGDFKYIVQYVGSDKQKRVELVSNRESLDHDMLPHVHYHWKLDIDDEDRLLERIKATNGFHKEFEG